VVATLASLHLFAVLSIALWTKSRPATWAAFLVVMIIAFALGNPTYSFLDGISTVLGLAMGLSLISEHRPPEENACRKVASSPTITMPRSSAGRVSKPYATARMFELPKPRRPRKVGRWIVLALLMSGIYAYLR
jgi:hypothetical protein